MNSFWEKLWIWTTLILGAIAILSLLSVVLPILFLLALPFFLMGLVWLLILWFQSIKREKTNEYDEDGARYTRATIVSKESSSQEIPYDKNKPSS
ncbi:MAG: hypothetical protein ACK4HQ_00340 [Brevinematales bacterium]